MSGTRVRLARVSGGDTPTGLLIPEVRKLSRAEKAVLAEWHISVSGRDEARLWLPGHVRRMDLEQRIILATDPDADRSWRERELRRVRESPLYFAANYGAVQPEEGGAIPFDLWPEQEEAMLVFMEERKVIVLKARQLGLTWLAIHFAIWGMAFNPETPNAKVLALSKIGEDAEKLLKRARKVNELLPPFLRQVESRATRDSNRKFKLAKRGSEMLSLMGTPEAARSETAWLVIVDEFGFIKNGNAGPTWTAVQPTIGTKGKVIVISTGNGRTGNGAAFADLWDRARAEGSLRPIFLPYDVHPARRSEGWRAKEAGDYLLTEDFEAEYPETEEQALQGTGGFHVYPHDGINAAERLGARLEPYLVEFARDGVEWGIDWGDFSTAALWGIPLPGGGIWIFDELGQAHVEPGKASEAIVYRDPARVPALRFTRSYADSNPVGTNKTFARTLREAYEAQPNRYPEAHIPVPFSQFKEGGGEKRRGVNTVAYIVWLLKASAAFNGDPFEASGVLAISPRCKTLLAQLRNLERDAETGKVRKPALDPRHAERGDHFPDALVALLATRARHFRQTSAAVPT